MPPQLEIDRLIRAKYPIILIHTTEESRALRAINIISEQREKMLYVWSLADGFTPQGGGALPSALANAREPVAALTAARQLARTSEEPTIIVFLDLHRVFSNPVVIRHLRHIVDEWQRVPVTAVIIAPSADLTGAATDLDRQIAIYDWPLPDRDELRALVTDHATKLSYRLPVDLTPAFIDDLSGALAGLTELQAVNAISHAAVTTEALDRTAIPILLEEKRRIINESGVLEYFQHTVDPAHIGGLLNLKRYLTELQAALQPEAAAYGLDTPRGFLALGLPGTGKSTIAKAATGGVMPLIRLDIGALMGGLVGQSEANARKALAVVERVAPCVVWIDEIEKGLGGSGDHDGGTKRRVDATILTWMAEHTAPVLVVATANDVRALPPEFLRAGRFDSVWFVDLPAAPVRAEIAAIHLAKRNRIPADFDLAAIANATDQFTGAEIEQIVIEALRAGFADGQRPITTGDLLSAAQRVVPVSRTMAEKVVELREWATARARMADEPANTPAALATRERQLEL